MRALGWMGTAALMLNCILATHGLAQQKSAAEISKELANPNTSLASYAFKNTFTWYEGALPDADDQFNYGLTFQPVLPFPLANGDKIIWRPAVPVSINSPVFNGSSLSFDDVDGLGDIGMDLVYAPDLGDKLLAIGIFSTLPTATDRRLGARRLTLGPEILVGQKSNAWVAGLIANHQWDIGGVGTAEISTTLLQPFVSFILPDGWTAGTGPSITYDFVADQWTVPLQVNASKTTIIAGTPWKFGGELNYFLEKPDSFGKDFSVTFTATPVLPNPLANLFVR